MIRLIFFALLFISIPLRANTQGQSMLFCAYDYMANCSEYPLTSPAAKRCMADVGLNLSPKCVNALVNDGYITKQEVIDFAAKRGVTVIDTPEGLKRSPLPGPEMAEKPTATPVENDKTEPGREWPVIENDKTEPGKEWPIAQENEIKKPNILKRAAEKIKKTYVKTKEKVKTSYRKTKERVKKTYAKVKPKRKSKIVSKVKRVYKKYTKKNVEYSRQARIIKQNKFRNRAFHNGKLVVEGHDADFGRYKARPKGYSRKRYKYNYKKHYEDHKYGHIRVGGIGAQF